MSEPIGRAARLLLLALSVAVPPACDQEELDAGVPVAQETDAARLVEEALPRFRAAPERPRAERGEGVIVALEHLRAGRTDEAEQTLDAWIEQHPEDGYAYLLRAVFVHEGKHYARARPLFEDVIRRGPTFERAYNVFYYYGWCLLQLGEDVGARAAFEAHLEFEPELDDSWTGLGRAQLAGGLLEGAQTSFQRAMELAVRPQDLATIHAHLGEVLLRRDEVDEARAAFLECVRHDPEHHEAWFKLSRIARKQGDEEAALEYESKHRELLEAREHSGG